MREKLRGGARVLGRPVELFFERNAGFSEHLGAGAAETVDERPVAEIERVGELRHLRSRPIEIAVMEQQLQAAQDLLRGAADKANDQGRGEKAKPRDGVQDREVTRGQLKGRRRLQRGESAAGEERLWTCKCRGHNSLYTPRVFQGEGDWGLRGEGAERASTQV